MFKTIIRILAILALVYLIPTAYLHYTEPVLKWNWDKIDLDELSFPNDFIWGVASAAHQVEGNHTTNNWANWENQVDAEGNPRIARGEKCGLACDHWNRYPQDIKLMQELGVKSYRFSVSWSKIMPEEGVVDKAAIQHYSDVVDSLLAAGIEPMITLHHFAHPMWFEEKGAFEKEENIAHFVEFAAQVFIPLRDRVKYWCTVNEPAVFIISAYFDGVFPPGKQDPELAALVLKNMYLAHVKVYEKLKKLPHGARAHIGIVKNMQQLDPMNSWNLFDRLLTRTVNKAFNGSFISTFTKGVYKFNFPTLVNLEVDIPNAPYTLDFVGLNYYSHNAMSFSLDLDKALKIRVYPGEKQTDMDYTLYPEGMYRAIKDISVVNRPIIITENGVADAQDAFRGEFIKTYLYAVSKAIEDGYDVRGYHYWSFVDNFEWDLGYDKRFGLYEVNFETQERTLREGSKEYQRIVKAN